MVFILIQKILNSTALTENELLCVLQKDSHKRFSILNCWRKLIDDFDHDLWILKLLKSLKSGQIHTKLALNRNIIFITFSPSSQCLSLVCLRIPLLHDGVVEILVSKEARTKHHCQADCQHSTHHAEIRDNLGEIKARFGSF